MNSWRIIFAAALAPALSGCGFTLIDAGPPPNLYDLEPQVDVAIDMEPVSWQLLIEEPSATRAVDTDRILVRPTPNEIRYYANVRWSDRAPSLIQAELLEGIERTGKIVGVGRQTIGLRGDFTVLGDLRAFEAHYTPDNDAPFARIDLTLKIVRQPSAKIVSSQSFALDIRAKDGSLASLVAAMDEALGAVIRAAVPWILTTAERDYVAHKARLASPVPLSGETPGAPRPEASGAQAPPPAPDAAPPIAGARPPAVAPVERETEKKPD